MAKLISKTYGEALFELAVEEDKTDELLGEIEALREILSGNKEFSDFLNHPKISREEKLEVIHNVFDERMSRELVGFLVLVINKNRFGEIGGILDYFLGEVKRLKGICTAYVTTAVELDGARKREIEDKLLETTGARRMEIHYALDGALIGGMVIRIGDRVVDSSIRTKLSKLQKQLLNIQI